MAGMIQTNKLAKMLSDWATNDEPLAFRASMLPVGQYADGRVTAAVPGMLAGPWNALARLSQQKSYVTDDMGGVDERQRTADILESMSMVPMAGVTARATGRMPRNALGTGGSDVMRRSLQRGRFDLDNYGTSIRVHQNPASAALKGLLARTKHKAMRAVKDPATGDVYFWDAGDPALHAQIAEKLGVKDFVSETYFLDGDELSKMTD